jgi:hypothetical protein
VWCGLFSTTVQCYVSLPEFVSVSGPFLSAWILQHYLESWGKTVVLACQFRCQDTSRNMAASRQRSEMPQTFAPGQPGQPGQWKLGESVWILWYSDSLWMELSEKWIILDTSWIIRYHSISFDHSPDRSIMVFLQFCCDPVPGCCGYDWSWDAEARQRISERHTTWND